MAKKVIRELVTNRKDVFDGSLAEDYDGRSQTVLVSLSKGSSSSAIATVLQTRTASLEAGARVKLKIIYGKVYVVSFGSRQDRIFEEFDRNSDEVTVTSNVGLEDPDEVWDGSSVTWIGETSLDVADSSTFILDSFDNRNLSAAGVMGTSTSGFPWVKDSGTATSLVTIVNHFTNSGGYNFNYIDPASGGPPISPAPWLSSMNMLAEVSFTNFFDPDLAGTTYLIMFTVNPFGPSPQALALESSPLPFNQVPDVTLALLDNNIVSDSISTQIWTEAVHYYVRWQYDPLSYSRARVWAVGDIEPGTWDVSDTPSDAFDSSSPFQLYTNTGSSGGWIQIYSISFDLP